MRTHHHCHYASFIIFCVLSGAFSSKAVAGDMDLQMAWPLCGRISENPPPGWIETDGCPAERFGNQDHSDVPLSSTYGPRIVSSLGYAHDYHQGIDISTPVGTPIFAVAKGDVRIAGHDSGYSNPLIALRHYRPGYWGSCPSGGGCYHSYYMHVSSWVVGVGDTVEKGQLLGFTGQSDSGHAHLHFELRDAPDWDPYSSWNRDAIHPLRVLAYDSEMSANTAVTLTNVDASDPMALIVDVHLWQAASHKTWDILRVEMEVYDKATGARIVQPGENPDQNGYHVNPPWLDMELRNFEYAHKDSSLFPWSWFDNCPYASDHGAMYDSDIHLGQTDPLDSRIGLFNGIRTEIASYSHSNDDYDLRLRFLALTGAANAGELCIKARALSARGTSSAYAVWNCSP